jgi:hypothetical protein
VGGGGIFRTHLRMIYAYLDKVDGRSFVENIQWLYALSIEVCSIFLLFGG